MTNPTPTLREAAEALLKACEIAAVRDLTKLDDWLGALLCAIDGGSWDDIATISINDGPAMNARDYYRMKAAALRAALEGEGRVIELDLPIRANADLIAMILSEGSVENAPYLAVQIANRLDPPSPPEWGAQQVARLYLALKPAYGQRLTRDAARQIELIEAARDLGAQSQSARIEALEAALREMVCCFDAHGEWPHSPEDGAQMMEVAINAAKAMLGDQ